MADGAKISNLPDEVLLDMAHIYLEPAEIRTLALSGPEMHRVLLTHPGDIARTRALYGTMRCVKNGWWDAARISIKRDGAKLVTKQRWEYLVIKEPITVATEALLTICYKSNILSNDAVSFAIELLTCFNADPCFLNNMPIRLTAYYYHLDIFKLLLEDPRVDPSADNNSSLSSAARHGYLDIVSMLLNDPRVVPSYIDAVSAISHGNIEIVKLLLADSRIDASLMDSAWLRCAISLGYHQIVEILLKDSRLDPSARSNQAIMLAAGQGRVSIVRMLLDDSRVDPGAMDNQAIKKAARHGHDDVVKLLAADPRVDASVLQIYKNDD